MRASEHPLIESYRVEGTRVLDRDGKHSGSIDHLVIDKVSGRVMYAVISFGGFLGMGAHHVTVPWEKLRYSIDVHGYHLDADEADLKDAPTLPHDSDREGEQAVRGYWELAPYWA